MQEQIEYVQTELKRGVSPEDLTKVLLEAGYTPEQIENLLQSVNGQTISAPASAQATKSSTPTWVKILVGIVFGLIAAFVLMVSLVSTSLNSARDSAQDATDKTNLSSLRIQAELFYMEDSSYAGFCDSISVDSLATSLSDMDCAASVTAYRVSNTLLDGAYYCVDSVGAAEVVLRKPAGTSCYASDTTALPVEASQSELSIDSRADSSEIHDEKITSEDSANLLNKLQFNRVDAELFYNDNNFSYLGVCDYLSGDHGVPIETDCADSATDYRVSAFMFDIQKYWCIDSTGHNGSVVANPVEYSCL